MATLQPQRSAQPSGTGGWRRRPAEARFLTELPWLHSRHSFSFGHHHDPAWERFGALRVINDDIIQPGNGFGLHPHRDMEIVTLLVEGELQHRDSLGHGASLRSGEVQRMTAGRGIAHSEMNLADSPCRLLQIWIEPQQRSLPPSYSQMCFSLGPGWTLLIDPEGAPDTLALAQAVRFWRAQPGPGDRLELPLQPGCLGWLQLIDGEVVPLADDSALADREPLQRGDGLGFQAGSLQALEVLEPSDVLLLELP